MMNRSRYLAGVLTLGLLLAACSEGPIPARVAATILPPFRPLSMNARCLV